SPAVTLPGALSVPGYDLLGVLGQGGMGVVYRARQVGLGRGVALKMLAAGAHAPPEALARVRTEAGGGGRPRPPNIVQIYEVGQAPVGPFLVLEYVEGGSLADRLRQGPLPARAAAELVRTLALAVQHAHAEGVLHRDLKPANVLL